MKLLLLDQSVPRGLKAVLAGYNISTAREKGWAEISKGSCMRRRRPFSSRDLPAAALPVPLADRDRHRRHSQSAEWQRASTGLRPVSGSPALSQQLDSSSIKRGTVPVSRASLATANGRDIAPSFEGHAALGVGKINHFGGPFSNHMAFESM